MYALGRPLLPISNPLQRAVNKVGLHSFEAEMLVHLESSHSNKNIFELYNFDYWIYNCIFAPKKEHQPT